MKVYCMYSEAILMSTHNILISIKKKIIQNYAKYNHVCNYGTFCWGFKNVFERAVVNEPSVFEPL